MDAQEWKKYTESLAKGETDTPYHYKARKGGMETIDEMTLIFGLSDTLAFCKLNAWKYRARALYKNGKEDLKKSDWYLRKYEELYKKQEKLINGKTYVE